MELTISYWVDATHTKARTLLNRNGIDVWFDYYPSKELAYLSYYEIRDAYAAGTLTGPGGATTGPGIDPVDYPKPSLEQQKLEKLALFESNTKHLQAAGYPVTVNGTEYI